MIGCFCIGARRLISRRVVRIVAAVLVFALASAVYGAKLVLVAGGGREADGSRASEVSLNLPFGVDFDNSGTMYIAEYGGHRIRSIDKQGIVRTVAGTGEKGYSGDNGPARKATLNSPHNLAVAPSGDIFVADTFNDCVRRIDAKTATITTFAGSTKGFGGDGGLADRAQLSGAYCIAFDPQFEHLYLADLDNRRIRVIDMKTRIVTTVAGNGQRGVPQDGALAVASPLVDPRAVAADSSGNVYVLERSGNALRVVDSAGRIRTLAGTGERGNSGDDGPARMATFDGPKHLCVDREGNILIADTENHVIRKYLSREQNVIRVAGTGKAGNAGIGGPPLQVLLNKPHGVYVDSSGALYIADSENNRVLRLEP
jgi:sugar lactone lactonase YvrE